MREASAVAPHPPASRGPRTLRRLAAVLVLALGGCSLEQMAADTMTGIMVEAKAKFYEETIPRFSREAGPALLATIDALALASPRNRALLLLQAELHATFAFSFLEVEDPAWAIAHYHKSQAASEEALRLADQELQERLAGPTAQLEERLANTERDALPGLFWWAFALGSEINLNRGDPAMVARLDASDAVMSWVLERDEAFFQGGPHLYFAMRHVALPASLGGDPGQGLIHFEAVDRITSGRFLFSTLLRAQYHAPSLAAAPPGSSMEQVLAAQRRAWEAFYQPLKAVVSAPADLWPAQALPNAVAKERALVLLRDPEANNIIPPAGVVNEFVGEADSGDWEEENW